jgi:hypothetical protein
MHSARGAIFMRHPVAVFRMKLPPNIHLFEVTADLTSASEISGGHTIPLADHALFKMVRYVLLRPLRPELDLSKVSCHFK